MRRRRHGVEPTERRDRRAAASPATRPTSAVSAIGPGNPAATASAAPARASSTATRQPSAASRSALARPIPLPPPVTNTFPIARSVSRWACAWPCATTCVPVIRGAGRRAVPGGGRAVRDRRRRRLRHGVPRRAPRRRRWLPAVADRAGLGDDRSDEADDGSTSRRSSPCCTTRCAWPRTSPCSTSSRGGRVEMTLGIGYRLARVRAVRRREVASGSRSSRRPRDHGAGLEWRAVRVPRHDHGRSCPTPVQKPRPPIYIGGSDRGRRRCGPRSTATTSCRRRRVCTRSTPPSGAASGKPVGAGPGPKGRCSCSSPAIPSGSWEVVGPHVMYTWNSNAEWAKERGVGATPYPPIKDIEEMKGNRSFAVVTPEDCVELLAGLGPDAEVTLHPLMGGLRAGGRHGKPRAVHRRGAAGAEAARRVGRAGRSEARREHRHRRCRRDRLRVEGPSLAGRAGRRRRAARALADAGLTGGRRRRDRHRVVHAGAQRSG